VVALPGSTTSMMMGAAVRVEVPDTCGARVDATIVMSPNGMA
jgi:hypothetical protein